MRIFFVDEYLNSSLRVLNVGDEKPVSITSEFSSCEVETNYSWYFGCNDSRLSSQEYLTEMKNLFKLEKGSNYYTLKVRNCFLHPNKTLPDSVCSVLC